MSVSYHFKRVELLELSMQTTSLWILWVVWCSMVVVVITIIVICSDHNQIIGAYTHIHHTCLLRTKWNNSILWFSCTISSNITPYLSFLRFTTLCCFYFYSYSFFLSTNLLHLHLTVDCAHLSINLITTNTTYVNHVHFSSSFFS
jgi:hypothetical protein